MKDHLSPVYTIQPVVTPVVSCKRGITTDDWLLESTSTRKWKRGWPASNVRLRMNRRQDGSCRRIVLHRRQTLIYSVHSNTDTATHNQPDDLRAVNHADDW